jgi:AraC family transcriptional regulator
MPADYSDEQVRFVDFPETRIAVLEHRGDPALTGDSIRRFIAWRKQMGLPPRLSATFNILRDDPATTVPAEFRLDLCAATEREVAPNDAGIVARVIPGGRCAIPAPTTGCGRRCIISMPIGCRGRARSRAISRPICSG